MNDIIKYAATERLYVAQFGGTIIDDRRQWEIDADVLTPDGKTVSIKDQLKSSAKYGNVAIGVETSNPHTGATKPDWFGYIATTGFAILCAHPETKQAIWIRCTPEKLKAWVKDNASKLRKFNLQPSVIRHNEQQGRTYTDGWGYLVPVQSLLDSGFSFTALNQHYNTELTTEVTKMNFGQAIEAMENGSKVTRAGWNGKGLSIELQVPDEYSKMTLPYIFLNYPSTQARLLTPANHINTRVPWFASQTDMLAKDWAAVE